jgi:hypothetical protein
MFILLTVVFLGLAILPKSLSLSHDRVKLWVECFVCRRHISSWGKPCAAFRLVRPKTKEKCWELKAWCQKVTCLISGRHFRFHVRKWCTCSLDVLKMGAFRLLKKCAGYIFHIMLIICMDHIYSCGRVKTCGNYIVFNLLTLA